MFLVTCCSDSHIVASAAGSGTSLGLGRWDAESARWSAVTLRDAFQVKGHIFLSWWLFMCSEVMDMCWLELSSSSDASICSWTSMSDLVMEEGELLCWEL